MATSLSRDSLDRNAHWRDITRSATANAAYHPTRRAPSHWGAVNLVRSGTKQPQRSATGAEVKARLFRLKAESEPLAHLKMQEGLRPLLELPSIL